MQKLGLDCSLGFLAGKSQQFETNILDLNYDCYVEIFLYLTALEDKLNLCRAHWRFRNVFARQECRHYAKINMRMLRSSSDWDYLLSLFGVSVVECEIRHGRFDDNITKPFLTNLNAHCKNLQHLYLLFTRSVQKSSESEGSGLIILKMLQRKDLKSLSLIDASAADVLQVKHFMELEALHIDGLDKELNNKDFGQVLQSLKLLRRLSIRFDYRREFPPLSVHCPQLEHLSLNNFDGALDDVGYFPHLKSLCIFWRLSTRLNHNLFRTLVQQYRDCLEQLQMTMLAREHVVHIVEFKELKSLVCNMWCSEDSLLSLSQLRQLECLHLNCKQSTDRMMQLLAMIGNCSQLQHIKLGILWQKLDLEYFSCALQEKVQKQSATGVVRYKLLLTVDFQIENELQKELRRKLNPQYVKLDCEGTSCCLCKPDHFTRHAICNFD
ncbi:uncharacterized protein LOC6558405 [Drosophila grimshawi]|uniref:uncharacterized protein LOC6558405 n=1 Tax=Drosophila grimshawi TaxID=7222 RepID=UPI000C86F9A6|nr:uncharacterized protein LOC6558405 [Drosophila grimshawi]